MEKKKKLEDLLVSVSENDDYAFRVFYDLYYRSVFRFTYYFLRNKEACGEVVSNVFVAVWKSRVSLRRISNIDAYLYVVARNESNRYLRECQAQRRCLSLEDIPISVLDLNSPPHDGEAPDSRLLESEVEELVRRLINDLPERCRTVFLLNRQEGLSSREIARALSLSESTVRVQIKIAVDRIVTGIRKHYPDLKLISLLMFLFSSRF
ncbi:RNA polymerase sigma-70 factor [Alistipes sp. kh20]|uniref:RNA polymerase sigma-70 factor n=1 Tax=Alistipes TaxID=239759 RepID=UPI0018998A81|nr:MULTISPECIES: RNA polymerase sigma-70 factor [Alistipes]MBS4766854.1 RNA polymerase sigma-70 factor [Alistipes montrealensis]